jgi:hypothetical protein
LPFLWAIKNPQAWRVFLGANKDYFILPSLYGTCLRTTGSYFLTSIFSGMVRLFLSVV